VLQALKQRRSKHTDAKRRAAVRARVVERRAASRRLRGGAAAWTMDGCLEEDRAALRKLRDESECDVLKEAWTDEDPREWKCDFRGKQQPCVQVTGERVTGLKLSF